MYKSLAFSATRSAFAGALTLAATLLSTQAQAALTEAEQKALAKASQNPVASLISVPFENNYNGEDLTGAKQAVLKMKFFERLSNEVKSLTEKLEDDMF